jgi:hypothetical protein
VTVTRQVTAAIMEDGTDAMEDVIDTSDVEEKEIMEAHKPGYYARVWGVPNVCRIALSLATLTNMSACLCSSQTTRLWIWRLVTILDYVLRCLW